MSSHGDRTTRVVDGALRSAIFDHGPITLENLSSATKRVVAQIRSSGNTVLQVEGVTATTEHLHKRYENLRHGHERLMSQQTRLRAERDALKVALQAGWTWGQYEWASTHPEEMEVTHA